MNRLIIGSTLTIFIVGSAYADLSVTFDFESATVGGSAPDYVGSANQRVTTYMTNIYGSSITSTGASGVKLRRFA